MKLVPLHRWDLTPKQAMALQAELAGRVLREDGVGEVRRVAGVDVGFEDGGKVTQAAVAVLDFPGFAVVERIVVREPTRFPYIPGLLSFREAPAVLARLSSGCGCCRTWCSMTVRASRIRAAWDRQPRRRRARHADDRRCQNAAHRRTPEATRAEGRLGAARRSRRNDRGRAPHARRRDAAVRLDRPSREPRERGALGDGLHDALPPARRAGRITSLRSTKPRGLSARPAANRAAAGRGAGAGCREAPPARLRASLP